MRIMMVAAALLALVAASSAAERMRFWNLTANTVTELYLTPAGTENWGANQTKNDPDGTVEHDERLTLKGVTPGRYDVKLVDKKGRRCLLRNVDVQGGKPYAFAISEKDLAACQ